LRNTIKVLLSKQWPNAQERNKMGCYDTVNVPCPRCGKINGFQSKGGECRLEEYSLSEAPIDVLSDVNRHTTICECGTEYKVITYPVIITHHTELVENPGTDSRFFPPNTKTKDIIVDDLTQETPPDFKDKLRDILKGWEDNEHR
jgi:hypothetical protein